MFLKHKDTGLTKEAFQGFSWTTFFFGCWPALFRGDVLWFITGFVVVTAGMLFTEGIGSFVYCLTMGFCYNDIHMNNLLEKGYEKV